MTFFYDLNKKLKEVLEQPKSVNQQLNERAESKPVDEGMFDSLKSGMAKAGKVAKAVGKKGIETLGHGSDADMIRDLQKKMGVAQTGEKPRSPIAKEEYGPLESAEGGTPMTPKQKSFAKLAPPADKITFADKIAGAKKEVDEMLGDVAAEAMRNAVGKKVVADEGSTGDYSAKKARAGKDIGKPGKAFAKIAKSAGEKYGSKERGEKVAGAVLAKLRAKESTGEVEEGWDDMIKDVEKRRSQMKTGEKIQGHKGEIEKTATGIKHTRNYDPKTGETDSGDDGDAQQAKRGRGRPKKTDKAPERVTAKAYKHKGGRVAEQGEEELDEKAVSKAQQRFMGMVHATQKGEKAPSKEVAKVAKTMKKKDAEDFAATKHKGLPEKVKSKKKEKTEESDAAPTSGKGLQFGKGIYDSINREIESIIAESMNVSMSDSTEGGKSLTVSATDEDAVKLAAVLKLAGVGGDAAGSCPTCGSADCGCGDVHQAVDENAPDWPTDEVTSDDALQYAGGLNKPKTTVAGDGQTTVPVTAVQVREEDLNELSPDTIASYQKKAMPQAMDASNPKSDQRAAGVARTIGRPTTEGELDEQEQVMAPESIEEAQEMCEVCEAVPCKCDEEVAESLARFRSLAGIQEAAKPDYIDLDKDGDKEESMKKAADDKAKEEGKKVEESIFKMTNLWKAYRG